MIRVIFFLFLLSPLYVSSQSRVLKASPPSWITPVTYSIDVPDSLEGGSIYELLLDKQFNVGSKTYYFRKATKVLNETGLELASYIHVNLDPSFERLVFHSIIIKRKDETINKLQMSSFEILRREENSDRLVYDKSLDAILNLDDVQVGDIIEYSYSLTGYNPVFNNKFFRTLYFNFSYPVGHFYTRIVTPIHRELQFKAFNNAPDALRKKTPDGISYTWEAENVHAIMWDDRTPSWFDPYMKIAVTEYASWEQIAKWAVPLYTQGQPSSSGITKKVNEIKESFPNLNDQVNACIRFVQDEIRYLSFSDGIQGYRPHSPAQVFKQKFGDCKDKSLLLVDMLKRLGIEGYPALVSTTAGKRLPESLPSPVMFDHCIANFSLNDSSYWVDPTMTLQRGELKFRTIPDYYNALLLSEKTKGFVEIPPGKNLSGISVSENYFIKSVGQGATLSVETTYYGSQAEGMRNYWKSSSPDEIKKGFTDFYASDYADIVAKQNIQFEDDEQRNILKVKEEYSIDKFWEFDSTKEQYKTSFYARVLANYLTIPSTKKRLMPLQVDHPVSIDHIIKIHLPEAWTIKYRYKRIEAPSFFYSSQTEYTNELITLSYAYQSLDDHVETDAASDHIRKIKEAADDLGYQLTYNVKSEKSMSINSPFILITIGFGIALFFMLKKLYRYDPRAKNYSVAYDSINGFLILPAIGLVLGPIQTLRTLLTSGYFENAQWRRLTDSTFASYNPAMGILTVVELLVYVTILGVSLLCGVLFSKRRTSLPLILSALLGFQLLFSIVQYGWLSSLGVDLSSESIFALFRSALIAGIWIPVFLTSDRVKGTFRERLD